MFEDNDHLFPAKPELVSKRSRANVPKMLLSLLLFAGAFLLLFSEEYILVAEVILVLLIHELGHLALMKIFGYNSLNMVFIPFLGAIVSGNKNEISQKEKILISIMGPLPGIIAGCVLYYWTLAQGEPNILWVEVSLLFLAINIVNLLPLDPLDGGRIMESIFFPSNDAYKMYFTLISSLVIIGAGVYFNFYIIVVFGFLMALKVRSYQRSKRIHDNLDDIDLDYKKGYEELSDKEYWTMRRIFLENNPKLREIIPSDDTIWENENLIVEQINQLLRVRVKKDLNFIQKLGFILLTIGSIIFPVYMLISNPRLLDWYLELTML